MILDIEGKEINPGDICIAKSYNGVTKVKIFKETAVTVQLYYWSDAAQDFHNSKSYVMKGGTNCVFYKI